MTFRPSYGDGVLLICFSGILKPKYVPALIPSKASKVSLNCGIAILL